MIFRIIPDIVSGEEGEKLKEIDVRGMACPQPVILTRKAHLECPEEDLLVILDNLVARDNVLKLARSLGCSTEVEQDGGEFRICIQPAREALGGMLVQSYPTSAARARS